MKKIQLTSTLIFSIIILLTGNLALADILKLATTTSTENSGLLKVILPDFKKTTGHQVYVIAVGTGKALHMGEVGDVDVVLVHSRKAEDKFVAAGHGVNRRSVMYNDFIIVGPENDPAGILNERDSVKALKKISKTKNLFISRGDDSGTNKKERFLWKQAGIKPAGQWYREAGQGMGKVLQISSELSAYTLTDRGTWLSAQQKSSLKILVQGDKRLFNPYGVIAVNPDKYHDINYPAAMEFIAWLTSPKIQQAISHYTINNNVLFTPMAVQNKQLSKK